MCFAPQQRALFRHQNSKSAPNMMCFVHFDFQMCFPPQPRAIFHLSGQMAPDPPQPTFRPCGATNHWKTAVNRDFSTFAHTCIFFLLALSLLWSSLFFSSLTLSISAFPSVHIVGSLTSKLPSIIRCIIHIKYCKKIPKGESRHQQVTLENPQVGGHLPSPGTCYKKQQKSGKFWWFRPTPKFWEGVILPKLCVLTYCIHAENRQCLKPHPFSELGTIKALSFTWGPTWWISAGPVLRRAKVEKCVLEADPGRSKLIALTCCHHIHHAVTQCLDSFTLYVIVREHVQYVQGFQMFPEAVYD